LNPRILEPLNPFFNRYLVDNLTTDTFFNGKITVRQPLKGYRYSIDAVILAGWVRTGPQDRVLDLGTGCGIIPLVITHRHPGVRLIGVELQPALAELARQNVAENKLERCIDILNMDMKDLDLATLSEPVDVVVTNPPFYRVSSGRINPNSQRAIARHELKANLTDVLTTGGRLLKTGGRFACIYGIDRLVDLLYTGREFKIQTGIFSPDIFPEALHHPDFILFYREDHG